jgi:hypothetical protein
LRIPIRTSRWALWSSRIGRLAVPVIVVAVFLHRAGAITSADFVVAAGGGIVIGLAGLAVGLVALVRIWMTGDRGWWPASVGVAIGVLCLAPLVFAATMAVRYPFVHDVTTDYDNPPPILGSVRFGLGAGYHDPVLRQRVADAFPNAVTRDYPLPATETFPIVADMVAARGWQIIEERATTDDPDIGWLNAVAMTWLGWRDEVAVRVETAPGGSRVDIRSVSYEGAHDLGANGLRIEEFLLALDEAVTARTQELGIPAPGG